MTMTDIYNTFLRASLTAKLGARMLRVTDVTCNFECYNNVLEAKEMHMTLKDNGGIKIEAVRHVRRPDGFEKIVLGTVHTSPAGAIKAGRDLLGLAS